MTKEELEKEAENWLRKYLLCCNCEKKCNCIDSNSYCEEQVLKAYVDSAEPREKRIAELEEKISVLLSCKKCPENKGGYICAKEYENKCLAQKIQFIKELQEENAELKKDKKELCHSISEGGKACVYLNEQLTKAKDHIKKLLGCLQQDTNDPQTNYYVVQYMTEAEQFLKDSEVENV